MRRLLGMVSSLTERAIGSCVAARGPWLAGAAFFLTGLGYSATYPLVMVLVGKYFHRGQGFAVGVAAAGGGCGSLAMPFLMTAIAQGFGLRTGFWFYCILNLVTVVLACAILSRVRTMRRGADPAVRGAME